jgi:antitoxin (DNA-binding transcriptional repressor) of toxin-antitoxin stability system
VFLAYVRAWARPLGGVCITILAFFFFAAAGLAQDAQTTVRVDGRALFRVSEDGEITSERRADRVEQRLSSLLENLDVIPRARVSAEGAERVITVAGVPVTRVLPVDAENNLTDLDDLASQWAATINRELARARERQVSGAYRRRAFLLEGTEGSRNT